MDHTDIHLPVMIQAARDAGTHIMHYFRSGSDISQSAGISHKGQDNPLTQADLEANETIHRILMTAFPDYGWLSEESTDPKDRLEKQRVWIVDPLDGTREFIRGIPEFAVSIALTEAGQTMAACVFNPPLDELFTAVIGRGSRKNGHHIQTSRTTQFIGAVCLASNSETKRGDWEPFKNEFAMIPLGSIAYKLATLASGKGDLTFTLTPKNEWDIAAGELLVREAHGQVTDKDGNRITFNQPSAKLRSVLATNGQLHPPLLKRLANVSLNQDRR